jgi:hypothetical protein
MNPKLKENLINKFHSLFPTEYPEKIFMISDGWFDLVENVLNELLTYPIILTGIKERYGRLEVSYNITKNIDLNVAKNIETIIELSAKKSVTVCNVCGEESLNEKGAPLFYSLCEKHKNKHI